MLKVAFLGILQGVTEFLPISSSGHLSLAQRLFGFNLPLALDIFAHTGSLVAITVYFFPDLTQLFKDFSQAGEKRQQALLLVKRLILASLPIVLAGIFLQSAVERFFGNLLAVGVGFLITSLVLFLPRLANTKSKSYIAIGLAQIIALFPGVSRSGTTISVGRMVGLKKEEAFRFSFFLGIIAISGATVMQLPELAGFSTQQLVQAGIMAGAAFLSGLFSLKLLDKILQLEKMWLFSFYTLVLSLLCFVFYYGGM